MLSLPSDINEFSKLFKIPIPKHEEFWYYVQTLAKSPQYADLPELVRRFAEFEKAVGDVKAYKRQCFEKLVPELRANRAYWRLQECSIVKNLPRKKLTLTGKGNWLLSVDIIQANYSTLLCYDVENELKPSWAEFCTKHQVDPVLAQSKSFRQYVFGHLSPSRTQRIQHMYITQFIRALGTSDSVFISPDEVILAADSREELRQLMEKVREVDQRSFGLTPLEAFHVKLTPFQFYKIEGKGQYAKSLLDPNTLEEKDEVHLYGVPGNMYYLKFKQYVLGEPLEERDLFFWTEQRLAKWVATEVAAVCDACGNPLANHYCDPGL